MEPIRRFSTENYAAALESWSFLELSDKRPLFTSPFGDVFFESTDGFWFLDLLAGELSRRWETESDFSSSLNSREGQDEYLMIGLASEAESSGLRPGEAEVYSFGFLRHSEVRWFWKMSSLATLSSPPILRGRSISRSKISLPERRLVDCP